VPAVRQKAFEPRFRLRYGIRLRNAERIETERPRALGQRGFDRLRIAQKSRSA
jgi:hypothetical protein